MYLFIYIYILIILVWKINIFLVFYNDFDVLKIKKYHTP